VAVAPDLPGHGDDTTPMGSITLSHYADVIGEALGSLSGDRILVGHSMAGAVISTVAERMPDAVKRLVFVGAHLPADGQSVLDVARTDADTLLRPHLGYDMAAGILSVGPDGFGAALFSGCSADDVAYARARCRPSPIAPLATALKLTETGFGRVRRVYIETTADHAVSPGLQRRMLATTPCTSFRIDTGHAPFYEAPEELARLLVRAATED
jgi:pimeloyl-ACP methyl ester carboxylesterase